MKNLENTSSFKSFKKYFFRLVPKIRGAQRLQGVQDPLVTLEIIKEKWVFSRRQIWVGRGIGFRWYPVTGVSFYLLTTFILKKNP